jgi:hypothetical protein
MKKHDGGRFSDAVKSPYSNGLGGCKEAYGQENGTET